MKYDDIRIAASTADSVELMRSTYVEMLLNTEQLSFFDVYNLEERSIQCIKDGDTDMAKSLFHSEFVRGVAASGIYAEGELKNLEYKCVTCIVINAHAAIESGLSVQGAYAIRNSLLQRAAKAAKAQEYFDLCYEAFMSFTYMVKYAKSTLSADDRVNQVREYIRNNISSALTNAELAAVVQMSQDHLARIFKKSEGMTLREYVTETRVLIAQSMLRFSDCTLPEIASATGFSSQSHFGAVFRGRTGLTPAEYRKQNKKIYSFPNDRR